MKKLFLMLMAAFLISPVIAQQKPTSANRNKKEERKKRINAVIKQEEEGVITYKKHFAGGAKLYSDGYGGFIEIGRAQSVKKALLFQLEISERKHVKEEKLVNPFSGTQFIYGKINFFYPVKLGVQEQFLLGNKGNRNGVSITGNIGGGVIAGLVRPYLVRVDKGGGENAYVGYESADSAFFLNQNDIISGPNFGTGFNKLKVTPGLYVKPAVRFDYGKYNEMISAIEVGLNAEFYSKKIPQVIYNKQHRFFFSAYVSIIFGRRK
ncbi:MAG: hypothetical protein ABJA37_12530 [Ferruginibacter sp.]